MSAQNFSVDFAIGQYRHTYNLEGNFNQIITETSDSGNNTELQLAINLNAHISDKFHLQLSIQNYTTFAESMIFYDLNEDLIFPDPVVKAYTFGGRTYSFPFKVHYSLEVSHGINAVLGAGLEYFLYINRAPLGDVNLGDQHPRLNEFLPLIDEAFYNNRLNPIFSLGLSYKRFGFEAQIRPRISPSFDSFIFEGQEYQPDFYRQTTSFMLSYTFLRLGK